MFMSKYMGVKATHAQRGMSMVELLISLGVMGIIMMGVMSYVSSLNKSLQFLSNKETILDFERQIDVAIADQTLCSCMLSGLNLPSGTTQPQVKMTQLKIGCPPFQQLQFKTSDYLNPQNQNVTIDDIFISDMNNLTANNASINLNINYSFRSGIVLKNTIKTIFVSTNAGSISACSSVTPEMAKICSFIGGNMNAAGTSCALPVATPVIDSKPPTFSRSSSLSSVTCSNTQAACYVPVLVTGYPGDVVAATSSCTAGDGSPLGGTSNTTIGSINSAGTFQYTGQWPCNSAPGSKCTQGYTVNGVNVGQHSWSCVP